MLSPKLLLPFALILCAGVAQAQLVRGHSLATVLAGSGTTGDSEVYDIDHTTGKATKVTISTTLAASRCNCILMTSPLTGFIGTNAKSTATAVRGDIYSIQYLKGKITEKLLTNVSTAVPVGNNISQMVVSSGNVYFVSQDASGQGGVLQSVPATGGKVTVVFDWKTGATGLVNGLCQIGSVIYAATFATGTTVSSLLFYDLSTSKGGVVMALPASKLSTTSTLSALIVNMQPNPAKAGTIATLGVYGDLMIVDPANKKVLSHEFHGFGTSTAPVAFTLNSFSYDPVSKDWILGTRDGHADRAVGSHAARRVVPGVGSNATATLNSVNGMWHYPYATASTDITTGGGCPAAGGYTLTDVSFGEPIAGNNNFKLGAFGGFGGEAFFLVLGLTNPKLSLASYGAPGCFQQTDIIFLASGKLGGLGSNGYGNVVIPFGIPSFAPKGVSIYRQWVMDTSLSTKVNGANFVTSNGREFLLK